MTLAEFRASLTGTEPPPGSGAALQTLWWDAKGDWSRAHACAQQDPGTAAAIAHAYLHRKEGDLSNAGYWYRRAGRPVFAGSAAAEWTALAEEMLSG